MACAAEVVEPTHIVEFLTESSAEIFEYIDVVTAKVIAAAQREREEILGGALAPRI
jgi:hypothetical protein